MCPEQVLHVKGEADLGRLVHTDPGQCLQEYNKVVQESSGAEGRHYLCVVFLPSLRTGGPVMMSLTSVPMWPASPAVEIRVCSEILAGRRLPTGGFPASGPRVVPAT